MKQPAPVPPPKNPPAPAQRVRREGDEGDVTRRVRLAVDTTEKHLKRRLNFIITICAVVTALSGIAALGARGRGALDSKADAKEIRVEVDAVKQRMTTVEAYHADDRRWQERLESKVDALIDKFDRISGSQARTRRTR